MESAVVLPHADLIAVASGALHRGELTAQLLQARSIELFAGPSGGWDLQ